MGYYPSIYALAFFIVSSLSAFLGTNILIEYPKAKLNRHLFMMTIIMGIWAFGLSMSVIAPSYNTALFWRKISAIGRNSIHAFLVHLIIIMTSNEKKLNLKSVFLLYFPAIIFVFFHSFSPEFSARQYSLVLTIRGWHNLTVRNPIWIFSYIYYLSYMCISFFLLLRWRKQYGEKRNQANLILFSFIFSFVLGIFSDLILDIVFKSGGIHLGPLIAVPPMLAVFYITKINNLIKIEADPGWEQILNIESRRKLYVTISYLYLGGGAINFFQYFFPQLMSNQYDLLFVVITSISFYTVSLFVLLAQLIRNHKTRDTIVLIITLISIPIITLSYLPASSITIWVIPLVFFIIALVFDSRVPLVLSMLVGVFTQILVWLLAEKKPVHMDEIDFFLRAAIIFVAFSVSLIVNRIYVKRLKENVYQARFQKMISDTSFSFLNSAPGNYEENVDIFLRRIAEFMMVENSFFLTFNNETLQLDFYYEYNTETRQINNILPADRLSLKDLPKLLKEIEGGKPLIINNASQLNTQYIEEFQKLGRKEFKSIVLVPIEDGYSVTGFVGCDSIKRIKNWNTTEIDFLGTIANMLGIILMKVKSEKRIEFLAYYDHLTEIPNRTLFMDRLAMAIQLAKRNNRFLAVVLLDLDSFKIVNDTRGHAYGDILLKTISRKISDNLRIIDTVARFGGDEFLVLINSLKGYGDVISVMEKLTSYFKNPFVLENQSFQVSASMGVAVYPNDGTDAETLIKNADIAMYSSKSRGKNKYTLCTKEMKDEVSRNHKLSNSLFGIENRGELMLLYQPQVRISDKAIVGIEALLRWVHPELGIIRPDLFIPLAELNRTIDSIGSWVLRQALLDGKELHDTVFPGLRIAVNLSVVQFNNPNFSDDLSFILLETGFKPEFLEFEITESVASQEYKNVLDTMTKLRKLGVSFSIDDFGTDYSSLKRLRSLPINRIKIDKQFIKGIKENEKDSAITDIIINLAKSLDIAVIAEGVETETQLDFLKEKNCDEVQGYLFSKPLTFEEIKAMLASSKRV